MKCLTFAEIAILKQIKIHTAETKLKAVSKHINANGWVKSHLASLSNAHEKSICRQKQHRWQG